MNYWWITLILVLLFAGMTFVVCKVLKGKEKAVDITIFVVGLYLLIYKIAEYTVWQAKGMHYKVPIEFSAVSYFLFGISVFVKWKPLRDFSAFSATISGFIYYISVISAPDTFVANRDSTFLFLMAMSNHSLLYFGGMLRLTNKSFSRHFMWQAPLGSMLLLGYSYFMRWLVTSPEDIMLIGAAEATLLDGLFTINKNALFYTVYYILIIALLLIAYWLFYFLNQKLVYGKHHKINWRETFGLKEKKE